MVLKFMFLTILSLGLISVSYAQTQSRRGYNVPAQEERATENTPRRYRVYQQNENPTYGTRYTEPYIAQLDPDVKFRERHVRRAIQDVNVEAANKGNYAVDYVLSRDAHGRYIEHYNRSMSNRELMKKRGLAYSEIRNPSAATVRVLNADGSEVRRITSINEKGHLAMENTRDYVFTEPPDAPNREPFSY
ncbi:MAG: hypothetical protein P4L16_03175 [Chlamydiales bacterium]|nr:hypothetical protein [Chlamydiales bacterium]